MNNNIEDNLKKINIKSLTEEEKQNLWHSISVSRINNTKKEFLAINIFSYINMKKTIIIGALALLIVLGGGGVVAASNNSVPGDLLFGIEKAVEKMQLNLASGEKKIDLKFKFAEERISEIKKVSEEKGLSVLITDLSASTILEIEADVFTNETIVKIEADDKNYGYISELDTKETLAKEIAEKYSLNETKVLEGIDFEIENRDSRPEDKGFLNKLNSAHFSPKESDDVGNSLTELEEILDEDISLDKKAQIEGALQELLVLLGDDADLEIKRSGNKIEIESESGDFEVKVKVEDKNNDDSDSDDDSSKSSDDDEIKNSDDKSVINSATTSNTTITTDIKEDEDEIFCRGEWRDVEDCTDSEDDDSDDDSDDDNDSSDDDDSEDDDSNDDDDDDDDDLDDNSGSGSNN